MFFLFLIMMIILNSFPLRRRIADVTEKSCIDQGKKYIEAKPAQCKKGNHMYEVTSPSECESGNWTKWAEEEEKCTVEMDSKGTKLTQDKCQGTPQYIKTLEKNSSCYAYDKLIEEGGTFESCCEKIYLKNAKCNVEEIPLYYCEGNGQWTAPNGPCKTSEGGVTIKDKNTETDCTNFELKTIGTCSIAELSSDQCHVNYNLAVYDTKCILTVGETKFELDRLESESACQTELIWLTGECSSATAGLIETECTSNGEYTQAISAECVEKSSDADDDKSNNNTNTNGDVAVAGKLSGVNLTFKFTLILIISLLF